MQVEPLRRCRGTRRRPGAAVNCRIWLRARTSSPTRFISLSSRPTSTRMVLSETARKRRRGRHGRRRPPAMPPATLRRSRRFPASGQPRLQRLERPISASSRRLRRRAPRCAARICRTASTSRSNALVISGLSVELPVAQQREQVLADVASPPRACAKPRKPHVPLMVWMERKTPASSSGRPGCCSSATRSRSSWSRPSWLSTRNSLTISSMSLMRPRGTREHTEWLSIGWRGLRLESGEARRRAPRWTGSSSMIAGICSGGKPRAARVGAAIGAERLLVGQARTPRSLQSSSAAWHDRAHLPMLLRGLVGPVVVGDRIDHGRREAPAPEQQVRPPRRGPCPSRSSSCCQSGSSISWRSAASRSNSSEKNWSSTSRPTSCSSPATYTSSGETPGASCHPEVSGHGPDGARMGPERLVAHARAAWSRTPGPPPAPGRAPRTWLRPIRWVAA